MTPPAAQLDPDAWIALDCAATVTGESVRTWRRRAEVEATEASRQGRASLAYKAPVDGRGKPVWLVARSIDARLARCAGRRSRDDAAREALAAKYPQGPIHKALTRNRWLRAWRKLCEREREPASELAARIVAEARSVEGEGFKISVRSLYLWQRRYTRLRPDGRIVGVEGLVDRYGQTQERPERSPEAVVYFYDLYHTENKIPATTCHEVTLAEARRKGWTWPESYTATTAWLRKTDDPALTYLLRHGKRAWSHRYLPHLEIDYTGIEPGYFYQGDHTPCDFWASYKDRLIRPWLTWFQDVRSRCIVGWHIGPTPHQDAILAALRGAFRDWAIPSVARIDNGKDFTSKPITGFTKSERNRLRRVHGADWQAIARRGEHLVDCDDPRWLGVAGELGIELIYAIAYSPWSKGTTERAYGTFHTHFSKAQPTYCGNSPDTRPECVETLRRKAAPTLDKVREDFAVWLDVHHRTPHRGLDGHTPLGVWKTATHLRKAVDDDLAFLMDIRGLYKVTANGVRVKVGSATIGYGARSAALKRHVGRQVLVAVDPEAPQVAWAYTPDRDKRQLIGRLDCNQRIAFGADVEAVREAIAEVKRDQSIMHKAGRASARRTLTACERVAQHIRAKRGELLATGTDDKHPEPRIVPVQTGFEGVSKPIRGGFETDTYRLPDAGDLEDLFIEDEPSGPSETCIYDDLDELLTDEQPEDAGPDDEGLDGFL